MQRKKKTKLVVIGILIIIAGIMINFIPAVLINKDKKEDDKQAKEYIETTSIKNDVIEDKIYNDNIGKKDKDKQILMVLEIPSINLKKGLYYIDSKYNDIKYNVAILKDSTMPDEEFGNLILAGHNGNARISHFRYLNNVKVGELVYIYYNGIKYTYKIDNIYDIEKTGKANVERDENKTTITLITCKDYTLTKQKIFIGYLIEVNNY